MTVPSAIAGSNPRLRLFRRLGWAILWTILAVISIDFLLAVHAKYRHADPETYTMFWSRRGWLWTHLAGGGLTIVLGPLQFLTRWPRAFPRLHRWIGRLYLGGILIGSAGAVGLIASSPAPLAIRGAFAATMLAWLSTALVALIAIRRGRVATHLHWMRRNYLVTLSPISFRLLLPACITLGLMPSPALIATLLWLSWLLPLLIDAACCWIIRRLRAASARRAAALVDDP